MCSDLISLAYFTQTIKLNLLNVVFLIQVLNGLLTRDNQKEAISVPIGIIPAGSDNSLVWTVLGVRDPVSAAIAIVKVCFIFL